MNRSSESERRYHREQMMMRDEDRAQWRSAAARRSNTTSTFLRNYPKTSLVIAVGAGILLSASPTARKLAMTAAVNYFLRR